MKLQDTGTVLAPGSLHLPVFEEIDKQKNNHLGLSVKSLQAYLQSQLKNSYPTSLQTLYAYKKALEDLDETNSFYQSRQDFDFLNACLHFMEIVQLYNITSFPSDSSKEKDLKEIIEKLLPIDLWQKEFQQPVFEDAKQVQILNTEHSIMEQFFIDHLIEQGASVLRAEPSKQRNYYWSASNTRKEMEAAAHAIIDGQLKAEDVYIALANPRDEMVFCQIFNARKIPYTLLHPHTSTNILKQFEAALGYVANPSRDTLLNAIKVLYPRQSELILRYYSCLNPDHSIAELIYEPNPIISMEEFEQLKSLEAQYTGWKSLITAMESWDETSFEVIAKVIQEQNPVPSSEDIRFFNAIVDAYASVMDQIHERKDLHLLIRQLSHIHPSKTLDKMEGVLVGTRKEISPLRPIVFYIGADSTTFPNLTMHSGVFDEAYMAKLEGYPVLSKRLDMQRDNLFDILSMPESLYIEMAQADYDGKSIESSHELNSWLGQFPKFQMVPEASVHTQPDFSLSSSISKQLFTKDNKLETRAASLSVYERCPLQHLLRYGIRIHKPFGLEDKLEVKADIIAEVLQNAMICLRKPFWALDEKDIRTLMDVSFRFPREVFPHKSDLLDVLYEEYVIKIKELLNLLAPLSTQWNLDLVCQDYALSLQEELEGIEVSIGGTLNKKGPGKATFNLYENNPASTGMEDPVQGTISLDLQLNPVEKKAFKVSYQTGSLPANAAPAADEFAENEFIQNFLKSTFIAQDLSSVKTPEAEFVKNKVPTYSDKAESLRQMAASFIDSLQKDCVLPEHAKGACQYCSYRSICRNGAIERGS